MTLQTIEPQSPFDPESVEPGSGSSGRLPRSLIVGCGILLLLIGIALVAFLVKGEAVMRHLLAWSLDSVESQIMTSLPDDLTTPERQRLQRAFDAAEASVRASKSLDIKALQTLQPQLLDVSRSLGKGKLTRQQCLHLAQALEKLAGLEAPAQTPPQPEETPPASPGESEPNQGATDATLWTMNPGSRQSTAARMIGSGLDQSGESGRVSSPVEPGPDSESELAERLPPGPASAGRPVSQRAIYSAIQSSRS